MLSLNWFNMNESLTPGNTSVLSEIQSNSRNWLRVRITMEQYFKKGFYSSGYLLDGVVSNQPAFSNYQGSIIYAPSFNPMQDSRTLLLENFRAYNYIAGGWRNVFTLRKSLDFRLEGYLFKPFEALTAGQNQEVIFNRDLSKIYFAATAGWVLHSTVGPISLSVNYYDDAQNELGILLHVGFLIFNKTAMD
jgi:NTE family protein